jgi:hypothetical protein
MKKLVASCLTVVVLAGCSGTSSPTNTTTTTTNATTSNATVTPAAPATATGTPAAGAWQEHKAENGSFTVQVPGTPQVETKGNDMAMKVSAEKQEFLLSQTTSDGKVDPDKFLAQLTGNAEKAKNLTRKEVTKYQGFDAVEIEGADAGKKALMRFVFTPAHHYVIGAVSEAGAPDTFEADARKFMDSLQIDQEAANATPAVAATPGTDETPDENAPSSDETETPAATETPSE